MDPIPVYEIQRIVQTRLNSSEWFDSLPQSLDARRYLEDILTRSITMGESNSVLVIGPRESGKSTLVNTLLEEMCSSGSSDGSVLRVHLNGLLQTDDRIAIKEIARQLKLENTVEDKVFGSFADNLTFLLEALTKGSHETKVICCVLDEFDLFCTHHNQTLLYSLLDTSLLAHTPLVVIGLTCRLDVLELLEKRVKSRFSHRTVHLFGGHTYEEYVAVMLDLLTVPANHQWTRRSIEDWNARLQKLTGGVHFQSAMKRMFHLTKDVSTLKTFLFVVMSRLDESRPNLQDRDFEAAGEQLTSDSRRLMLRSMSVLELCLVLTMRHLHSVYDGEPFNFEMIYREYFKLGVNRSTYQLNKEVVAKAFEHLLALEVVRPVTEGQSARARVRKGYRLVAYLLESQQVEEALRDYVGLPTEVQQWSATLAT